MALIGADGERALCEQIAQLAPAPSISPAKQRCAELAALLRRSAICVTNDSGPMHLAAALDRAVVAVFGPTDPVWAGPYQRDGAVVRAGVACSPCYLRRLSECPNGHACMRDVTAATVIERIEAQLAQQTGKPGATSRQAHWR